MTITNDATEITFGHARKVQIGAWVSSALPSVASCPSVGYTAGTTTITKEDTFITATADQLFDESGAAVAGTNMQVQIPISQIGSLSVLALAMDGAVSGTYLIDNVTGTVNYKRIFLTIPGKAGADRVVKIEKARLIGSKQLAMSKTDGAHTIMTTWKLVPDTALTAGKRYWNWK